jgi:hypothetical protein
MKRLQDKEGEEKEEKREKKPNEKRERPWRSNMKAGGGGGGEIIQGPIQSDHGEERNLLLAVKPSVEEEKKRDKRDSTNIQRFMKEKRDKARKAEVERKVQEELRQKNIQIRLKALDLERRNASTPVTVSALKFKAPHLSLSFKCIRYYYAEGD